MTKPSSMTERHVHVEPSVINDYDLDVVDEALLHPEKSEYIDHFGFTVQVRSDNEYDVDTSDSEFEDASTSSNNIKNRTSSSSPVNEVQDGDSPSVLPDSCESSIINSNEDWQLVSNNTATAKSSPTADAISATDTSKVAVPPTSYYDLLLSKCTRSSHDSEKQVQLKQETSHNLELLKERSSEETDWGM